MCGGDGSGGSMGSSGLCDGGGLGRSSSLSVSHTGGDSGRWLVYMYVVFCQGVT